MSYTQPTFLGATVADVTANIGWGNASTLSVRIVEDPANGDAFLPERTGTVRSGHPVYFSYGNFKFSGLLQSWNQTKSREGYPVFDCQVIDPRELLEGCQVITGLYNGSTAGVPNLFNAFGWWENQSFGASEANDTGMPWIKVRQALSTMATSPIYGDYGGPITFKGYKYSLDLSRLPVAPPEYRIPSPSLSLLEIISTLCEDGGCDFLVELNGFQIVVRTISRTGVPPLGTIRSMIASWGNAVIRSSSGVECRNELTSSFLIGGDVANLNMNTSLRSFWGYDLDGNPILGNSTYLWMPTKMKKLDGTETTSVRGWPQPQLSVTKPKDSPCYDNLTVIGKYKFERADADTYETMSLNASSIADILGSVYYTCSTLEMRLARVNYESWSYYMTTCREDDAKRIGLVSPFTNPENGLGGALGNRRAINLVNDNPTNARLEASAAVAEETHARCQRVYQFVKSVADEYMGRKFVVGVPFLIRKQDPTTFVVSTNYDVTDGGYLPEGSSPLGLSLLNEDILKNPDGRFRAFVRFDQLTNTDLSSVSNNGVVFENGVMFMEAHVDPLIIETPNPGVVITLPGPVYDKAVDAVGNLGTLSALLQQPNQDENRDALERRFVSIRVSPNFRTPTAAAVPLKSNTLTYGPWVAIGAAGKTRVDIDQTLTPWQYGGYDEMQAAAMSKVVNSVTNMQDSEIGVVEEGQTPRCSLGDTILSGGPNLTGIDIKIGTGGITTSYRFGTYSPKFGSFSKGTAERIRRAGLNRVELRKSMRAAIKENMTKARVLGTAANSARAFMELAPAAFRRQSPHDVITSFVEYDSEQNHTLLTMQSSTYEEAVTLSNAHKNDQFKATAIMHMNGLFRPFCTKPGGNDLMPSYATPTFTGNIPNRTMLDPFKGKNDIEVYAWGDQYSGLHAYRRGAEAANSRPVALRGPLVMSGWGYDVKGYCVPPNPENPNTWMDNYLLRQDQWKVGPIDIRWNEFTGTWTCNDVVQATLQTTAAVDGSGLASVSGGTGWDMNVFNTEYPSLASGTRVICGYSASQNKWHIINVHKRDFPDLIRGTLTTTASAYNPDIGTVFGLGGGSFTPISTGVAQRNAPTIVYNMFNSAVPSGKAVIAQYAAQHNAWLITAADC